MGACEVPASLLVVHTHYYHRYHIIVPLSMIGNMRDTSVYPSRLLLSRVAYEAVSAHGDGAVAFGRKCVTNPLIEQTKS